MKKEASMHWANHLSQAHHGKLAVVVLSTMLCLASADSLAAEPGMVSAKSFSNSPLKEKSLGLKLDLGPAMSGDDCEDDYADLLRVAASSGKSPAAAAKPGARVAPAAPATKPVASVIAAPAAAAAPVAPPWEVIPADKTLHTALARWAAVAGWQLVWELPVDYAVSVRTEIRGSFTEAVGLVAKSMETAEIPMKAIFYDGNRVLRIVAKGTE